MSEAAQSNIRKEIAALEKMTVGQLQKRYADVFGEPARSGMGLHPEAPASSTWMIWELHSGYRMC